MSARPIGGAGPSRRADPDARFTGWSPGQAAPWGTEFVIETEVDGGFRFGLPVGEASAQEVKTGLTVEEAIGQALTGNPDVQVARLRAQMAAAAIQNPYQDAPVRIETARPCRCERSWNAFSIARSCRRSSARTCAKSITARPAAPPPTRRRPRA